MKKPQLKVFHIAHGLYNPLRQSTGAAGNLGLLDDLLSGEDKAISDNIKYIILLYFFFSRDVEHIKRPKVATALHILL